MMMNGSRVAAAVRLADGTIRVESMPAAADRRWARAARRLPLARGLAALAASLSASVAALLWSAHVGAQAAQAAEGSAGAASPVPALGEHRRARWAAMAFASFLSVGPFWAIHASLARMGGGRVAAAAAEAGVRLALLVGYLWAVGRWHRIAEVFAYHGAEHKTISCYEAGDPLVPEVVAAHSRFHPRCGTAFAFWAVMVVSTVGAATGELGPLVGTLVRLAALALAVGVGYEIVRAAARSGRTRGGRALRAPGLVLQHLTTREPDLGQIETAIAALRACATEEQRAAIDAEVHAWRASGSPAVAA